MVIVQAAKDVFFLQIIHSHRFSAILIFYLFIFFIWQRQIRTQCNLFVVDSALVSWLML